ncbi:MAG TPA: aminotransferase class I/II-fold pyridoxal phosphate-dependent enzyme [Chthoniobacteraceae bacterium]|jgi:aminotransferase|nr:aminotransferase class I/II-fold pyridoxal phosphate-dependent enzyme [Chthoniobacteraceae bacterium]
MNLKKHIAHHIRDIPRSGIRDFFEIVQSMKNVISLGIGEPDFNTPWHIREAAIYSLEKGRTGYTSNLGLPKLRDCITDYVVRNFGIQYDSRTEVLVTVGVSEAIDLALRALLNPGDEVLYHEPCYVSYSPSITLAHGVPVAVPTFARDNFRLTAEELEKKITGASKVLMMNFPCNPTGATQSREELEKIAALCIKHDLIVLTDEIYSELTYDGASHISIASLPGMRERSIFLHGFSKAFAMTGFRIGYACAPAILTEAMMKIHQYGILCAGITSQDAAIEALEQGAADVETMRREYELRRNYVVNSFNEMGLDCFKPFGSFYVFPSIARTGLGSQEFSMRLLKEKCVAVVPGTAFGVSGEGHVRACYATSFEQLKIAMTRIAEFVSEVKSARAAA